MMDFERWVNQQKPIEDAAARAAHEAVLEEDGVAWQDDHGQWWCECCVCRKTMELPVDTLEVSPGCEFHCGGSPSCCP